MTSTFVAQTLAAQDDYTNPLSAGSIDGTLSVPGGQMRKVTDTENKISIVGGRLIFASGKATPATGDPGYWLPAVGRANGLVLFMQLNFSTIAGKVLYAGFDTNQAGGIDAAGYVFNSSIGVNLLSGSSTYNNLLPVPNAGTDYVYALAMRAAGAQFFQKSGAYFLLEYITSVGANSLIYPAYANLSASFSSDYIRAMSAFLASPLVSDSFSNSFGTTDGQAQAETSGLGSGGSGVTWTQRAGTWANTSGRATISALSGGVAIATVTLATNNIVIKGKLTRAGGSGGIIVRYVDASNYVYLVHDGTNLNLIKRVAGVETTVKQTAITYSADAELILVLTDTKFRGYYNNTILANGTEYTIADAGLQSSMICGLYTTDITNSFDDFVVYARGTNNEYTALNNVGTLAAIETLTPSGSLVKQVLKSFTAVLSPTAAFTKKMFKNFTATLTLTAGFIGTALLTLRRIVTFSTWTNTLSNEGGIITQTKRDFTIYAGDTLAIQGTVLDYTGSGVNITGCLLEWVLYKGATILLSKSSGDGIFTKNALLGTYEIQLSESDTTIAPGLYHHECEMTDLAGNVTTVQTGSLTVFQSRV